MERFRDLAARETRSVTVFGRTDIPDGEYGFLEFFCDEPGCDCRRAMIVVLRSDTDWNKIWASINYGWESVEFYKQWGGPWFTEADAKGPFLDPLNPQTPSSPALLNLFRFLLKSPDYAKRIQIMKPSAKQWMRPAPRLFTALPIAANDPDIPRLASKRPSTRPNFRTCHDS